MMRAMRWLLVVFVLNGCSNRVELCDLAGEFPASEGIRNTCIPRPFDCEPSACALGCSAAGDRCAEFVPSNGFGAYFEDAGAGLEVVLVSGAMIDTGTGTVVNGNGDAVVIPNKFVPAPELGVPGAEEKPSTVALAVTVVGP